MAHRQQTLFTTTNKIFLDSTYRVVQKILQFSSEKEQGFVTNKSRRVSAHLLQLSSTYAMYTLQQKQKSSKLDGNSTTKTRQPYAS